MDRRSFLLTPAVAAVAAQAPVTPSSPTGSAAPAAAAPKLPSRPKVPGTLSLRGRTRTPEQVGGTGAIEKELRWNVAQTAIIIIDMWDTHGCLCAAQRVAAMAIRMNPVVNAARTMGVQIIHAPSDTMKYYEGQPWRIRMQQAPRIAPPFRIGQTTRTPEEARTFPINDGCDDPTPNPWRGPAPPTTRGNYPWERENAALEITGYDGISDDGEEIYNFLKQEGITNVALMGVHANVCIMNRAFGCREMTRLGFNAVVVRDLIDAAYDPRKRPFVSNARATELVAEFIEAHWCPSILSADLTQIVLGTAGPATA
ncbi:MAG: isochorismatase family protein [Bryobacteraceae bacterium]|jgi:nicotinamidase-related amidase